MFALNMSQRTYPVGAVVRLSELYLSEYPKRSDGVWYVNSADLLGSGQKYVDLSDAPIIMTSTLARRVVEATPEMGESLSPGFQRIYTISEMVGVVQPNPCTDCLGILWSRHTLVLLVKEITIGTRNVSDAGWTRQPTRTRDS
jgi:hypothetical protein